MVIEARESGPFSINVAGEGEFEIPTDRRNLVAVAAEKLLGRLPDLTVNIRNGIPACGGFGASGAAIIGGLLLANELREKKLASEELYDLAIQLEGHPDNVSAALFGGLVINARNPGGRYSHLRVDVDPKLKFVAILPDVKIETESARRILPKTVTLSDAVTNVQHAALLVGAFVAGDYSLIGKSIYDELHEKHRKKLIPYYDEFRSIALDSGALAFTISGAGSGCIAFCLGGHEKVLTAFRENIRAMNLNWRAEVLEAVNKGAELTHDGARPDERFSIGAPRLESSEPN